MITFHLATLALLIRLLGMVSRRAALYGGFLLVTLPMSWYFGRMVNYEPLALWAVTLQLSGWVEAQRSGSRSGLALLAGGIVLGGLVDWSAFFFAVVIAGSALLDLFRGQQRSRPLAVTTIVTAALVFAFDLLHLGWATGSLGPLQSVVFHQALDVPSVSVAKFVTGQIEACRHYYTHTGLISAVLVLAALATPRSRLAAALFDIPDAALARRFLAIAGVGGSLYVLAAPTWAAAHAYWQMYLLPYLGLSMVLVLAHVCRCAATDRRWRVVLVLGALEIVAMSGYTRSRSAI